MNKKLEKIWREVPVDYYQKGVAGNILQRLWHKGRLNAVLDFLESQGLEQSKKKILDVGCASGWFISEIANHYPKNNFFGIDVYREAVAYAKIYYPKVYFSCGDAHHLPFSENSFDIVICINVLEHIINPKQILAEIKRVTKPDGKVVIGMDSENFLFSLVWYLWKKINGRVWRDAHLHKLKPDALENLFLKGGFKIEKRRFFNLGMAVIFLLTR
ncbi:MAG: class I SAM-dependent methyltransferase [bacterium]|nr:class I SAM-dependent methyltransferase [bacterium]